MGASEWADTGSASEAEDPSMESGSAIATSQELVDYYHLKDRRAFVTRIVQMYRRPFGNKPFSKDLSSALVDFILDVVIEPDYVWARYSEDVDEFSPAVVEQILLSCLAAFERGTFRWVIDLDDLPDLALPFFVSIIRDRWHCPVPFILC